MFNKDKQLEELNKKIAEFAQGKNWGEIWLEGIFLPTYYFPHQYNVIFVAIQPSTNLLDNPYLRFLGNFNISPTEKKFQDRMMKFGFGGSYVTDIVKLQRLANERPTKKEIEMFLPFLEKELEIINPKIVVALGEETYQILNKNRVKLGIEKLEKIFHPAGTAAKSDEQRDKQFIKLQQKIEETNKK